jgi:hypothetical protein
MQIGQPMAGGDPMLIVGVELGQVIAPSTNAGTFGMAAADVGVASATVNTSQLLGGSIGTALLNTVATTVSRDYVSAHFGPVNGRPSLQLIQLGLVHGYVVTFWWTAAIFGTGALISTALFRPSPLTQRPKPPNPTLIQPKAGPRSRVDETPPEPTPPTRINP